MRQAHGRRSFHRGRFLRQKLADALVGDSVLRLRGGSNRFAPRDNEGISQKEMERGESQNTMNMARCTRQAKIPQYGVEALLNRKFYEDRPNMIVTPIHWCSRLSTRRLRPILTLIRCSTATGGSIRTEPFIASSKRPRWNKACTARRTALLTTQRRALGLFKMGTILRQAFHQNDRHLPNDRELHPLLQHSARTARSRRPDADGKARVLPRCKKATDSHGCQSGKTL